MDRRVQRKDLKDARLAELRHVRKDCNLGKNCKDLEHYAFPAKN